MELQFSFRPCNPVLYEDKEITFIPWKIVYFWWCCSAGDTYSDAAAAITVFCPSLCFLKLCNDDVADKYCNIYSLAYAYLKVLSELFAVPCGLPDAS